MKWAQKQTGFTIVELLIVVVVIAILAAITIVAYNGITQRAKVSMLQSDLVAAVKTLESYKVSNGGAEQYPDTLAQAKLKSSPGISFGYTVNNTTIPASFCLYADNGALRYTVSSTNTSPKEGSCTITNLVANPSFTTNTTGWSTGGYGTGAVATATRTAGIGPTGGYAMRSEWSTAATSAGHQSSMNVTTPILTGKTYTASVWVRSNQSIYAVLRVQYGTVVAAGNAQLLTPGQWVRVSYTFTASQDASGVNVSGRINDLTGTTNGLTFDVTNFMLTEGDTLYTYGDGSLASNGWSWTGTAGASTSTGPAL